MTTPDPLALIDFFSIPATKRTTPQRRTRFARLSGAAAALGSYLERERGPGYRYIVGLEQIDQGVACCATLDEVEDEIRQM